MKIVRPIITEKSLLLASRGWYTFEVAKDADKARIAKDVETIYHVSVTNVRTVSMHGKVRRTGRKMITVRRSDWKKALVQLEKGQKIDAFEVTSQEPEKQKPAKAESQVKEGDKESQKDKKDQSKEAKANKKVTKGK